MRVFPLSRYKARRLYFEIERRAFRDVIAYSDSNIKTGLQKIENAVDKLEKINGYTFKRLDMPNDPHQRHTDLDLINKIDVVRYKYKDPVKGTSTKIGFIAQDVQNVLPDQISFDKEYVPDIFRTADSVSGRFVTLVNHGLNQGGNIKIFDWDNNEHLTKVVSVISADVFEIEKEIGDKLFVFGREVDDLQVLEHNSLFALAFSGVKLLHKQMQDKDVKISDLETRIKRLEEILIK